MATKDQPEKPEKPTQLPVDPPRPDHGLPGQRPGPGKGPHPDQELPETAPKPKTKPGTDPGVPTGPGITEPDPNDPGKGYRPLPGPDLTPPADKKQGA